MADIILSGKPLAVNPLKVSQPVGASLAFLGLAQAMPLEHGSRGCTSFNKLFFMRHFREPIALQTTAMEQMVTVLGADGNVVEALRTIAETNRPQVVGLITTGLSETQGADIPSTVTAFRQSYPQYDAMAVVPVNASDALGCLETGFALAVEAIIRALVPAQPAQQCNPRQINVLTSSMLSTGDIEAIREWIEAFGLTPIILPDIGDSLDGHLIEAGYSTLTYGGTPHERIAAMGQSIATLVIGGSLHKAADLLKERTGIADYRFAGLLGLEACDALTLALSEISGQTVPARLERQRDQLQDAMVDCCFQLGGSRIAIGADADLLSSLTCFLTSMGGEVVAAVAPAKAAGLADLPLASVTIGDLEDLELNARDVQAELLITNSHGKEIAERLGIPLLRAGFPQYDFYGGHARSWVGYRGSRQALFDLANLLAAQYQEIAPYRSRYWQGTPRAAEISAKAATPAYPKTNLREPS